MNKYLKWFLIILVFYIALIFVVSFFVNRNNYYSSSYAFEFCITSPINCFKGLLDESSNPIEYGDDFPIGIPCLESPGVECPK